MWCVARVSCLALDNGKNEQKTIQKITDTAMQYLSVYLSKKFPMMTITSSMMMMMSCLVDPVCAEVVNQSNSGLQHSSTLVAWVCRAG